MRAAVVGCGRIAQLHIQCLLRNRYAELAAVCDANEERARATARTFNVRNHYADLRQLLEREQVDVVHITTSPQTHLALSITAMNAGCHLLVEKPMALNLDEADRMIEAATANKVRLSVVHDQLFLPVVLKARALVDQGAIGEPLSAQLVVSDPENAYFVSDREHWCHTLPGGIFGEMLPHPLYLARAFIGGIETSAVRCQKLSSSDWLRWDELRVVLQGQRGVATIAASANGPSDIRTIDIAGTEACLHVGISSGLLIRYTATQRDRLSQGLENVRIAYRFLAGTGSAAFQMAVGRYHTGHHVLIDRFLGSLACGTELPVTLEDSREVMRLYEAITSRIQATPASPGDNNTLLIS